MHNQSNLIHLVLVSDLDLADIIIIRLLEGILVKALEQLLITAKIAKEVSIDINVPSNKYRARTTKNLVAKVCRLQSTDEDDDNQTSRYDM